MTKHLTRAFTTTSKQIKRSGWLAWASVFVMTLAFFISSVFVIIAFSSNLFLKSIENKPHIYIFFNAGTKEENIKSLNDELLGYPEVESIEYTDETGALGEFRTVQERLNPEIAENIRPNVLPPSLGIRLNSIEDANTIIDFVTQEEKDNEDIFAVRFSKETIDTISTLFYWIRLGGGTLMILLLIVIFFFTLLTVEFRTFSRSEEIGIMQLVGGSLWFIRSPFILEGTFYGLLGAFISTSTLFGMSYYLLITKRNSSVVNFIYNLFGGLSWPQISIVEYLLIFLGIIALGGIIGAFNSFVAIRRYIH